MTNTKVESFLDALGHAQRDLIDKIRKVVSASDSELVEGIKWNAPSYSLNFNDIITFNFRNYGTISLIFHTGPKGKDTHTGKKILNDDSGRLLWLADKRFALRIDSSISIDDQADFISIKVKEWTALARIGFDN